MASVTLWAEVGEQVLRGNYQHSKLLIMLSSMNR